MKIDPNKTYNLTELVELRVFPWIKDRRVYRRIIIENKSLLRVEVKGDGKGREYRIKGKHLLKFVKDIDLSTVMLLTHNAKRV